MPNTWAAGARAQYGGRCALGRRVDRGELVDGRDVPGAGGAGAGGAGRGGSGAVVVHHRQAAVSGVGRQRRAGDGADAALGGGQHWERGRGRAGEPAGAERRGGRGVAGDRGRGSGLAGGTPSTTCRRRWSIWRLVMDCENDDRRGRGLSPFESLRENELHFPQGERLLRLWVPAFAETVAEGALGERGIAGAIPCGVGPPPWIPARIGYGTCFRRWE